jgi:hypothetical protein
MSANPAPYRFTIGDTLSLFGPVLSNGQPYSIAGWTPTCKLRRDSGGQPGDLIATLSASVQSGGLALGLSHPASETQTWHPGTAWLDIRFVTAGGVTITTPPIPVQLSLAASR